MCSTHTLQLEGPDHVGGQLLGVRQGDAHDAVGLGAPAGPVLELKKRELIIFSSQRETVSHCQSLSPT